MDGSEAGVATGLSRHEPAEAAELIGLKDAGLIGTQPIELPEDDAANLRKHGARAEVSTRAAAALLRVSPNAILNYIREGRTPRLGHRYASPRKLLIPAADLAAFIEQTARPLVPTTGRAPKPNVAEARRVVTEARRRHNLPET